MTEGAFPVRCFGVGAAAVHLPDCGILFSSVRAGRWG